MGAPNNTLVCFAVKEEAAPFQRLAEGKSGISILVTGIGEKNVVRSLRDVLQKSPPDFVFTCGFAGGLDPAFKTGDLVFLAAQNDMSARLAKSGARPVTFFCAPRIVPTAKEKAALWKQTGAHAVEMESGVIHKICAEHGIPVATVRVILDTASEDLPLDFNQLANPDLTMNYGKLAWALMKSPGKIPALVRLQKNCRFTAEKLADVLVKVIWTDSPKTPRPVPAS